MAASTPLPNGQRALDNDLMLASFPLTSHRSFQVIACAFSADDNYIFTGGIDNVIRVAIYPNDLLTTQYKLTESFWQAWDKRKNEVAFMMPGHGDTITSLR